jgi:hypothetical protein
VGLKWGSLCVSVACIRQTSAVVVVQTCILFDASAMCEESLVYRDEISRVLGVRVSVCMCVVVRGVPVVNIRQTARRQCGGVV